MRSSIVFAAAVASVVPAALGLTIATPYVHDPAKKNRLLTVSFDYSPQLVQCREFSHAKKFGVMSEAEFIHRARWLDLG